jgi:hypothetical protein
MVSMCARSSTVASTALSRTPIPVPAVPTDRLAHNAKPNRSTYWDLIGNCATFEEVNVPHQFRRSAKIAAWRRLQSLILLMPRGESRYTTDHQRSSCCRPQLSCWTRSA